MSELNLATFRQASEEDQKKMLQSAKSALDEKKLDLQQKNSRLKREFAEEKSLDKLNPLMEMTNRLVADVEKDEALIAECERLMPHGKKRNRVPGINVNFDPTPSPSSTIDIRPEIYSENELKELRDKDNIKTIKEVEEEREKAEAAKLVASK